MSISSCFSYVIRYKTDIIVIAENFSLKFILEGSAVFLGGKLFNTKVNPIVYVAWALAQPIYIPVVGLMGLQNRYTWKT